MLPPSSGSKKYKSFYSSGVKLAELQFSVMRMIVVKTLG
jgi:hypothetical protein